MSAGKKEIRKRILMGPLDWITLAPFYTGVASMLGGWTFSDGSGIALALGIILVLISAGIYGNRLLFGWSDDQQRLISEWRLSVEKERNERLDTLYDELCRDGDPRTESLLMDLRTLADSLVKQDAEALAYNAVGVVSDVDRLVSRSVDYLQESLDLWKTAVQINNPSIKEKLLEQREMLILEVEKSLESLGLLSGQLNKAAMHSGSKRALAEIRDELDTRLRIAEEVENKMRSVRQSITTEEEQAYLRHAG